MTNRFSMTRLAKSSRPVMLGVAALASWTVLDGMAWSQTGAGTASPPSTSNPGASKSGTQALTPSPVRPTLTTPKALTPVAALGAPTASGQAAPTSQPAPSGSELRKLPLRAASTPINAAPQSGSASAELRAENCMVKLIQNVRVPAEVEGRITEMKVTEGAYVQAGDLLAIIDDTQSQLTLEFKKAEEREAELNAMNDVNYRDAVNSERSANAEAEAYKELRREGATPYWEMEKKILEAEKAKLRIELAKTQQDIAKEQFKAKRSERQMAEHELTRRKVLAPFNGFVESRIAQLGEWVQAGSPVLQLVKLEKLRIEGDIDALRYPGQVSLGTPVKVWIYANADRNQADPAQAIKLDAKIGFVSSEIDLNNRYRIWVEIDNEQRGNDWLVKPGMEADITVFPGAGT